MSELLLVCFIAFVSFLNLLLSLGVGEVILKPFSMYLASRGMEKIEPYYERIKTGFETLDDSLMVNNNLISFMFEATDYVWDNIVPRVADDLPPEEQNIIVDYLVSHFDGDVLLNKLAIKKDVVAKQLDN